MLYIAVGDKKLSLHRVSGHSSAHTINLYLYIYARAQLLVRAARGTTRSAHCTSSWTQPHRVLNFQSSDVIPYTHHRIICCPPGGMHSLINNQMEYHTYEFSGLSKMTSRDSRVAGWTEKAYKRDLYSKEKEGREIYECLATGLYNFSLYITQPPLSMAYKYFEPTREIISQAVFIVQEFSCAHIQKETENSTFLCWSILIDFISAPWARR